ncbi:hypothetical protein [Algibacter aquimarinus]|uniref:Uncharacterized protein n=1 Tax=Algibacter aquimarinus TaxID=1136748 RepID=A0ABP9HD31_9FLAO
MDNYKRRGFIKLSALGFASIALQLNSATSYAQMANANLGKWHKNTNINWDAFLERLTQLAKGQHQLPWNQKVYTEQVKQLLLQCNFPEFENIKKEIEAYENKNPNWFEAVSLHNEVDFQVSLFQFEKGEYIPHHDHPEMTGVINVVSGSALAKNYNVEEQLSTNRKVIKDGRSEVMQKCVIKKIGDEIIQKGDVSILTAHQGNIHSIMPNEYTQLVDVFTPAYKRDTKSIWYTVNEDGFYNGQENLFEAEYVNEEFSEIKTINLSREKLNKYKGVYKISNNSFMKVFIENEQLMLERTKALDTPGMKMKLLPYEENKYWIEGQNIRCTFNINSKNELESMTIHISETNITANKIE